MPQLHHRDPSIIGLLGASPAVNMSLSSKRAVRRATKKEAITSAPPHNASDVTTLGSTTLPTGASEALDELSTPPQSPRFGTHSGKDVILRYSTRSRYSLLIDYIDWYE